MGKAIVNIARVGCAAIEKHPLHFVAHLQSWLQIFVSVVQHADSTHAEICPKLVIFSTKLLGKACASQWYATEQHSKYQIMTKHYPHAVPQMQFAGQVMNTVFSPEVCEPLLAALVNHYVCVTPEELQCWQDTSAAPRSTPLTTDFVASGCFLFKRL